MVPYNLVGSHIECHHYLAGGGGTGREFPKELLNANQTKWYTNQKCGNGLAGWVHIKFSKPLILNGFGITSANDVQTRDIEEFRLYAKVIKKEKAEVADQGDMNAYQKDLIKGFDLMKTVKDEKFDARHQNKRYAFEQQNVVVSEIKLVIDQIGNKNGDGPQLCEIQALF